MSVEGVLRELLRPQKLGRSASSGNDCRRHGPASAIALRHQGLLPLIPDEAVRGQPVTRAWIDAAREEGIQLALVTKRGFFSCGPFSAQA